MAEKIQPVRGMHDYRGDECSNMQFIIERFAQIAQSYGYEQIITPILEKADLFARTAGWRVML